MRVAFWLLHVDVVELDVEEPACRSVGVTRGADMADAGSTEDNQRSRQAFIDHQSAVNSILCLSLAATQLVYAPERPRDGEIVLELDRHFLARQRLEHAEDELRVGKRRVMLLSQKQDRAMQCPAVRTMISDSEPVVGQSPTQPRR